MADRDEIPLVGDDDILAGRRDRLWTNPRSTTEQ
jgi:hypothetical protein